MMGWREARRRQAAEIAATFSVPPAQIGRPRLRVKRGRITGAWIWRLINADGHWLDHGHAATHAEALAVGLAALEAASAGKIPD